MNFCVSFPRLLKRALPVAALCAPLAVGLLVSAPAYAGSYEMGLKVYEQGQYDLAVRYFRKATAETGENPNVHYYLADALMKTNRLSEAQAEYQKILALAPDSQAARLSRIGLSRLRTHVDALGRDQWNSSATVSGSVAKPGPDYVTGLPAGKENYLDVIAENGRFVRWSVKKMPLKVYIESTPQGVRNYQPAFAAQARKAMDVWVNTLGHQISYELVTAPDKADIRVTWENSIDTMGHKTETGKSYKAGIAIPQIRNDQLLGMSVKIATFDIEGKPHNSSTVFAVAIHELGHAMGLLGHSADAGDIMCAENHGVVTPSQRDLNTIRELYGKPADVTNLPPEENQAVARSAEEQAEHDKIVAERSDAGIKRMEERVKTDDASLNWLNLGVAYFQKGKRLQAGTVTDANPPEFWFNKGLKAMNESLKREPNDPRGYHKRSLIYQALNDYRNALSDIENAIRLDRKEADYVLLKSWYQANLGQNAQARATLDSYLLTRPGASATQDVQDILSKIGSK